MSHQPPPPLPPGGIDCRALRPLLSLFIDGEFENGEDYAFEAHIAACDSCAREAHLLRSLKVRVACAVRDANAQSFPAGLERRIQRRAQRERTAKQALRLALPASIAAAVVGLMTVSTSSAVTPFVAEAVERHTDDVGVDFASPNAARIQRLLQRRLGHALRVPTFGGSVSLRGVRLVRMQRHRAAYLVYSGIRSKITVLAMPDPHQQFGFSDERLSQRDGQPLMVVARQAGYNVVMWRRDGVLYSMVADLGPREMMRLAREPAHRALSNAAPRPPAVNISY